MPSRLSIAFHRHKLSVLSNLDDLPGLYDNAMEQEFPESLQNMRVKHETILRVSLSRKVQENKGGQKNGKIDFTSADKIIVRKKTLIHYTNK